MARLPKQPEQNSDDKQIVQETNLIWKYLQEARRRREYDWFLNDQFYHNNQYLKYNVAARRVQSVPVERMLDRVTINEVYKQVRGINNFLNAEHPSMGVRPSDQADDAYLRAKKEKALYDYWYRHLELNKVNKRVGLNGCKYGVGWAKVTWDNDALAPTKPFVNDEGKSESFQYGEVTVGALDTFEVYPDPMATDMSTMRYIVHAPVRTISELQNNKLYRNTDNLSSDNKLAASNLRQSEIRLNLASGSQFAAGQPSGMDTVVTVEMFRKIFSKISNKWEIWVTTMTNSGVLLRHDKWPMECFPFEYFVTDVVNMIVEAKGVIHNIREPNRALNEMVSQVHESARIMGKLNWLMPRGSNVNVITDETGQFIEYDVTPGGRPEQAAAINLPVYIMQHINQLQNFISDIGGMHDSFNGNAPFAQASGDVVQKLSQGDQNNLTLLRDNFDDYNIRLAKLMFKTAKVNYKENRQFPSITRDSLGEARWFEIKPDEINTSDDVEISTGTQMPYSIADKQQMYMNLWKEKAITDPKLLLKLLEMPDIDAAMGDDELDIERQLDEIQSVIKDGQINDPIISENHAVHIETLDKYMNGDKFYTLSQEQQQALQDHRMKHIDFSIQLAQIQSALQMDVVKRNITYMLRMNKMSDTTPIERTQLLSKIGIQSDAGQVQLRGGLYVQDPGQAETQAQNEDIEMMELRAVQTSYGDNHQVHLETHSEALAAAQSNMAAQKQGIKVKEPVSQTTIELMQQHIKDHIEDMRAIQVAPGLVPNDQEGLPNHPSLNAPQNPAEMPSQNEPVHPKDEMSMMARARSQNPLNSPGKSPAHLGPVKPELKPQSATMKADKLKGGGNAKRKAKKNG
jgi:hypothetical protein